MAYNVIVSEKGTGKVEETIRCSSRRSAEQVEGVVMINLNTSDYKTSIRKAMD